MKKGMIPPQWIAIVAVAVAILVLWLVWNAPKPSASGGGCSLSCDIFDKQVDYLPQEWNADSVCGKSGCAIDSMDYEVAMLSTVRCVCDCECLSGGVSVGPPVCNYKIDVFNLFASWLGICKIPTVN